MIEAGETEQESMGSLPAWESELQLSGVWKSQALLLLAVAMTTSKLSAPLYARHCDVFLPTLFYVIHQSYNTDIGQEYMEPRK